ncbi:minor extracellular serine protease [Leucobacter sp. 7(1)]|uniref:S-layer homology domain-containing protein n=1 Tax=Leucobacter sp. 7(1) TaxID=1255613 RepID=UPI00097F0D04|nr:S-layer homology domain-containing protein [Leucobacter sp. 7(1)]SJN13020.1 minor extracellular serine protease [Leucobacter sp. 7(1)]
MQRNWRKTSLAIAALVSAAMLGAPLAANAAPGVAMIDEPAQVPIEPKTAADLSAEEVPAELTPEPEVPATEVPSAGEEAAAPERATDTPAVPVPSAATDAPQTNAVVGATTLRGKLNNWDPKLPGSLYVGGTNPGNIAQSCFGHGDAAANYSVVTEAWDSPTQSYLPCPYTADYIVSFTETSSKTSAAAPFGYAQSFWAGEGKATADSRQAKKVRVEAGRTQNGVDFAPLVAGQLGGKIASSVGKLGDNGGAVLMLRPGKSVFDGQGSITDESLLGSAQIENDRSWARNLAAGSYSLAIVEWSQSGPKALGYYHATRGLVSDPKQASTVTVQAKKKVTGLDFAAKQQPPQTGFTDVKPGDKFAKEITWMRSSGLSTGIKQPNGSYRYAPKENVTREAMAAFLFRQYSKPGYKAPAKSPFTDVKTTDKFYKEIAWMKDAKISTGVKQANGTAKYLPKASITREAMAAFMYRIDTGKKPATPKVSPFADMKPGDKFFTEIAWMHSSGLSTGITQPSGKPTYAPKNNVTREAMAAFLYRAQP